MAKSDRSENETLVPTEVAGPAQFIVRHDFGFQVAVPATWEVEYAPNATMKGGQVVYITPRGNVFFVSFGGLAEVTKRFRTLDEYGKTAGGRVPGQEGLTGKQLSVNELLVGGHRALISNVQGSNRLGEFVDIWIADLWCEVAQRYYSLYAELNQKHEFRYFPRFFASVVESLICHEPEADSPRPGWQLADVGFSPRSRLWFIQLFDNAGLTETYQSREIVMQAGTGVQYQWPQRGKPIWHIRERIFLGDVDNIHYDNKGSLVVNQRTRSIISEAVPNDYHTITYAYSLSTARGFIEFRDSQNIITKRIEDKWIVVENLTHKTVGIFPDIRLMAKKEDIISITVTATCIIIQGNTNSLPSSVSLMSR